MPEYKVVKVSPDEPRTYYNEKFKSTTYYIKVALQDANGQVYPKAVAVGKKSPTALSVGDTIYGTIEKTEFPEDKWHGEQNPNYSGSPNSSSGGQGAPRREYVDHHEDIKAQWAIGQAVQLLKETFKSDKTPSNQVIELWAGTFYTMVERVKNGEYPAQAPKTVVPEPISDDDADMNSLVKGLEAENIPLEDIPF